MKPGIYDGVPSDHYHADAFDSAPTLSASIAHVLLTSSPAHARAQHPKLNPDYAPVAEEKFDIGTAVHSLLLEGVSVAEVVQADSWRTAWAKEARDQARAHGRVPLLPHQYDQVIAMVDAVAVGIEKLDVDPLPLTGGKPEQTLVWTEGDVLCRSRLDWLHDGNFYLDDVKTTTRSAHPEAFSRNLYGLGYDTKAAFYLRGLKALTGVTAQFRWLVVETQPPYALSVVTPGPDVLALAEDKVDAAIALWRKCLDTDSWPAYPNRVCFAELPGWEETRWLAREAREEMAA